MLRLSARLNASLGEESPTHFGTLSGSGEPEDRRMNAKKIKDTRQRLSREYENLIKSINRNRMAAEEIKLENTEDEADRATISHNKELLYNLHESDFMRLRV